MVIDPWIYHHGGAEEAEAAALAGEGRIVENGTEDYEEATETGEWE